MFSQCYSCPDNLAVQAVKRDKTFLSAGLLSTTTILHGEF